MRNTKYEYIKKLWNLSLKIICYHNSTCYLFCWKCSKRKSCLKGKFMINYYCPCKGLPLYKIDIRQNGNMEESLFPASCSSLNSFIQTFPPKVFFVAQRVKNLPAMRETWVWSLGWEDLLEKGKATHSSILAWRIPWIPWGHKGSDMSEWLLLPSRFPMCSFHSYINWEYISYHSIINMSVLFILFSPGDNKWMKSIWIK